MEWVRIGVDDIHPKYEGETKNDEPNGIGKLTYPNGHKFEGEWNDGKQHGRGTFTWPDGRKYTGMFKNGKPYGKGAYTYKMELRTWASGKLLKRTFSGRQILMMMLNPKKLAPFIIGKLLREWNG